MASQWYYYRNGKQGGPLSSEELQHLVASGKLADTDMVWQQGMPAWIPAGKIKILSSPAVELDVKIFFRCPTCNVAMKAPATKAGVMINCPKCKQGFAIPCADTPKSHERAQDFRPDEPLFYYVKGPQRFGPLSLAIMRKLVANRQVPPETLVWLEGAPQWVYARDIHELYPPLQDGPPLPCAQSMRPDSWFVTRDGTKYGPFSAKMLKELAAAGRVALEDLCNAPLKLDHQKAILVVRQNQ